MTSKRCSKCGEVKPAGEFYAAARCLLGRRPECKRCNNAYHNGWARHRYVPKTGRRFDTSPENKARRLRERQSRGGLRRRLDEEVRAGVKKCRACGEPKGLDSYRQVKKGPARYDATCRSCRAEQSKGRRRGSPAARPASPPG